MKCLKSILMSVGNELVTDGTYPPGTAWNGDGFGSYTIMDIINMFTRWTNGDHAVIAKLKELGVEWPVEDKAKPIEGQQYSLTGGPDEPSIMRGDSVEACRVREPADRASFKDVEFDHPDDYEPLQAIPMARVEAMRAEISDLRRQVDQEPIRRIKDLRDENDSLRRKVSQLETLTKLSPGPDQVLIKVLTGSNMYAAEGDYEVCEFYSKHGPCTEDDQRGQIDPHTILGRIKDGSFNKEYKPLR